MSEVHPLRILPVEIASTILCFLDLRPFLLFFSSSKSPFFDPNIHIKLYRERYLLERIPEYRSEASKERKAFASHSHLFYSDFSLAFYRSLKHTESSDYDVNDLNEVEMIKVDGIQRRLEAAFVAPFETMKRFLYWKLRDPLILHDMTYKYFFLETYAVISVAKLIELFGPRPSESVVGSWLNDFRHRVVSAVAYRAVFEP
jgi:hypothetical protein